MTSVWVKIQEKDTPTLKRLLRELGDRIVDRQPIQVYEKKRDSNSASDRFWSLSLALRKEKLRECILSILRGRGFMSTTQIMSEKPLELHHQSIRRYLLEMNREGLIEKKMEISGNKGNRWLWRKR